VEIPFDSGVALARWRTLMFALDRPFEPSPGHPGGDYSERSDNPEARRYEVVSSPAAAGKKLTPANGEALRFHHD
jgi:hypothetical protein